MPKQPTYQEFLVIEQRLKAVVPRMGWLEGRFEMARCRGELPSSPNGKGALRRPATVSRRTVQMISHGCQSTEEGWVPVRQYSTTAIRAVPWSMTALAGKYRSDSVL